MIRLALRRHRPGLVACAAVGAVMGLAETGAYVTVAGATREAQVAFGNQMQLLGRQLSYLLPLPVRVDTVWGYYNWRGIGGLILVLAIWAALAGSGAARGEEEAGLVEQWVAAGVSRPRLLFSRLIAFSLAATTVVGVTDVGAVVGSLKAAQGVPWAALVGQSAVLVALAGTLFATALLVSQFFPTRFAAGGAAGGLVAGLFLLDGLSRTRDIGTLAYLSPFHLYNRTSVLAPGGHVEPVPTLVLLLLGPVLTALAAGLFARRDIGEVVLRRRGVRRPAQRWPSRLFWLRAPVLESFWEQRVGLLAWLGVGTAVAALMASLIKPSVDILKNTPSLRPYLAAFGPAGTGATFIEAFWFTTAQALVTLFAIYQVGRWTADDQKGRLAMLLATPYARTRVVPVRAAALAIQLVVLVTVTCALTAYLVGAGGTAFSAGAYLRASALLVPLAMGFAGMGALLSGVAPRLAVPVPGTVAGGSYLLLQLGPLLRWPGWVTRLSVYRLYGNPMTTGVDRPGLAALLALGLLGLGAGTLLMRRREVGS